jgi:hypothetical protein
MDEARAELDVLTATSIAQIPRDYMWWLTTVCMSRVAASTGAPEVARDLYDAMLPFAARNASVAGAASLGSAALYLGQLAAYLGDQVAADAHYTEALAFNVRTRQNVWAARTRVHYAEMLQARGSGADLQRARELVRVATSDAREIGMPGIAETLGSIAS